MGFTGPEVPPHTQTSQALPVSPAWFISCPPFYCVGFSAAPHHHTPLSRLVD